MNSTKLRILIVVLVALLALTFAGCKGESSPTAPSATPPATGTGTTTSPTPVTGATVTLALSNTTPVAPADVTVTATVTVNGTPAPDGTAVQFVTTIGAFKDTGTTNTIKVTSGGIAKEIITAAAAGTGTITVTVNNVQKSTTLTFSAQPTQPTQPATNPTITSVSPNIGLPSGGSIVTITGTNFRSPVRVIVDPGNGIGPKDAFVNSVTPTQIVAVMPAFDVATGSTLPVAITVVDESGTANQQSVTQTAAFTYASAVLTPSIRTLSPTSGPIDGGTRVAILGDSFQAPVQVFFGSAEAQVLKITFSEIDVVAPTARDTSPNASGVVTGPVDVKVVNVGSGKTAASPQQFRYVAKMQITTAGPTIGPFTGGTRVTIDGTGFNAPLAVSLAGVAAQVISVSPTELVVISSPAIVTGCADVTGPIAVTNTDNGDGATGPAFDYRVLKPAVLSATPTTSGGNSIITVANAVGTPIITVGDKNIPVAITATTLNPDGTTSFTIQVPSIGILPLTTTSCPLPPGVSGTAAAPQPTPFDVSYKSVLTTCTDTLKNALLVSPPVGPVATSVGTFTPFVGTITPGAVGPPATSPSVSVSPASETVAVVNTGNGTPLLINSVTFTNAAGPNGCAAFSLSTTPPAPPIAGSAPALNQCDALSITASYSGFTAPTTTDQCLITVTTNAGTKQFVVAGSSH